MTALYINDRRRPHAIPIVSKPAWREVGIMPTLVCRHVRHALGLMPLPVLTYRVRA